MNLDYELEEMDRRQLLGEIKRLEKEVEYLEQVLGQLPPPCICQPLESKI